MWKALVAAATVLFVDLWLVLSHNDIASDFVPLLRSLQEGRLSAYDFFLIVELMVLRLMAVRFGITFTGLKAAFRTMLAKPRMAELLVIAGSGLLTQIVLVPVVFGVMSEPLSVVGNAPDPIRRAVLMTLPVLWVLVVGLVMRGNRASHGAAAPVQQQPLPPPPQRW